MATTIYFAANSLVYAAFALGCTCAPARTSLAAGYLVLDSSGRGEFLVVYGGLQAGLALFFAWLACDPGLQRVGLSFALMVYVPVVGFRVATLIRHRPRHLATWAVAGLEAGLLAWAVVLALLIRPAA